MAESAEAYTQEQMLAVQALVSQYETGMTDWSIANIKAWAVPEQV